MILSVSSADDVTARFMSVSSADNVTAKFMSVCSADEIIARFLFKNSLFFHLFARIMREEPFIVLNVAHCTAKRMSNFVRQIDFAVDWQMLEAGKALFRCAPKVCLNDARKP